MGIKVRGYTFTVDQSLLYVEKGSDSLTKYGTEASLLLNRLSFLGTGEMVTDVTPVTDVTTNPPSKKVDTKIIVPTTQQWVKEVKQVNKEVAAHNQRITNFVYERNALRLAEQICKEKKVSKKEWSVSIAKELQTITPERVEKELQEKEMVYPANTHARLQTLHEVGDHVHLPYLTVGVMEDAVKRGYLNKVYLKAFKNS